MRRFARILLLAAPVVLVTAPAAAQDRYMGEVFVTAATYCPRNTLPADGRTLQISANEALFSLLGAAYGGDGRTTFGLPDLRGRTPVQIGTDAIGRETRPGDVIGGAAEVRRDPPLASIARTRGLPPVYGSEEPLEENEDSTDAAVEPPASPGAGLGLLHCVVVQGVYPSRN